VGDKEIACAVENGEGLEARSCVLGEWVKSGVCTISKCDIGFELKDNSCLKVVKVDCNQGDIKSENGDNGTVKNYNCVDNKWKLASTSCQEDGALLVDNMCYSVNNMLGALCNSSAPPAEFCEAKPISSGMTATASSSETGNPASEAVDNNHNLDSRWSANGKGQWLQIDLGKSHVLSSIEIVFLKANERQTEFSLEVSENGSDFKNVIPSVKSSGKHLAYQSFSFDSVAARYIRYIGNGNSSNDWNSLIEVKFNQPGLDNGEVEPPKEEPAPEPKDDPVVEKGDYVIVFQNDFEHRPFGTYTADEFVEEFKTDHGSRIDKIDIDGSNENRYLRLDYPHYPKTVSSYRSLNVINGEFVYNKKYPIGLVGTGAYAGGAGFEIPLGAEYDELYFSMKVYFPNDWDGVWGGKLPGLCGGSNPSGGASTDRIKTLRSRFGSDYQGLLDWLDNGQWVSGSYKDPGDKTTDGFSSRFMFTNDMKPFIYLYHYINFQKLESPYLDNGKEKKVYGPAQRPDESISRGRWVTLTQRIVMNSELGSYDGVVEFWFDNERVFKRENVEFRHGSYKNFAIDKLCFSTFYGGSGIEYAPKKDEMILYDDLVVYYIKDGVEAPRGNELTPGEKMVIPPPFGINNTPAPLPEHQ
jgi:hypothetical protein